MVIVIVGLVVVALVLIVFTWRFWRATRPARAPVPAPGKSPTV
jgi:O-antigen ligase